MSNKRKYYYSDSSSKNSHPAHYFVARQYRKNVPSKSSGSGFMVQALIASCLLMVVLVTGKLQVNEGQVYAQIKESFLGSFSYGPINEFYEQWFNGSVLPGVPPTGSGESGADQTVAVMGAISELQSSVAVEQYEDGIIIEIEQDSPILSLVDGYILHMGTSDKYGQYIGIQLADKSELTIGFLEKRAVSLYEHIKTSTPLGIGTELDESAYYYLALKKDGEYLELADILKNINLYE